MAKLILKASLANNGFIVSQKVIDIPINTSKKLSNAEVIISPIGGKKISVSDFSTGILPVSIDSINFEEVGGNKIAAIISFNELKVDAPVTVIELPITGKTTILINKITLIEKSPISNQLITSSNGYNKVSSRFDQQDSVVEHSIVGGPGQTVSVLTRSFIVPNGFKFQRQPSYKISGSGLGYTITSNVTKNSNGKITGKTFNVKYTFKDNVIKEGRVDTITFSYNIKEEKTKILEAKEKEQEEIYSIDTGREIGPEGGVKTIVIKGIPGSSFKILTQNSSNQAYDYESGGFGSGAKFLEGIIPIARKGYAYGEYRAVVNVPASATGGAVTTSLDTGSTINHEKIAASIKDPTIVLSVKDKPKTKEDKQLKVNTITISLKDGGESNYSICKPIYKDSKPTDANVLKTHQLLREFGNLEKNGQYQIIGNTNQNIILKKEKLVFNKNVSRLGEITFIVLALADGKFIRINRDARFSTKDLYVRASEAVGDTPLKDSVGGKRIVMDVGNSVRHSVTSDTSDGTTVDFGKYEMKVKIGVRPLRNVDRVKHGVSGNFPDKGIAYKAVEVKMMMDGVFGDTNLDLQINANNFLTIFSQ